MENHNMSRVLYFLTSKLVKHTEECGGVPIGIEYQGAYDGVLEWLCTDCGLHIHRHTGYEILESCQAPNYGPVYFALISDDGEKLFARNQRLITEKEYRLNT